MDGPSEKVSRAEEVQTLLAQYRGARDPETRTRLVNVMALLVQPTLCALGEVTSVRYEELWAAAASGVEAAIEAHLREPGANFQTDALRAALGSVKQILRERGLGAGEPAAGEAAKP